MLKGELAASYDSARGTLRYDAPLKAVRLDNTASRTPRCTDNCCAALGTRFDRGDWGARVMRGVTDIRQHFDEYRLSQHIGDPIGVHRTARIGGTSRCQTNSSRLYADSKSAGEKNS